jgi:CBS domain-containing protein
MHAITRPIFELTARDLMVGESILIPQTMAVRDAALLLFREHVRGAPVVDAEGRCVGALSVSDVARLGMKRGADVVVSPPLPITCSFQHKQVGPDGREEVECTLPPDACPFQRVRQGSDGLQQVICTQPHCVCTDWQVVQVEKLPTEEVRWHMTADPVTATPETPIRQLARKMIDAGIHRVIVVDDQNRPIGVVSSSDIMAAVAYGNSHAADRAPG